MNATAEAQILHWFDRALEQPATQRRDWVVTQSLPDAVQARVLRLVDAESTMGGFLEEATRLPHGSNFPGVGERLGNDELRPRLDTGAEFPGKRADDSYDQQVAIKESPTA